MKLNARVTSFVGGEKLKAYVSVLIDDKFLVKGIKGRFASMPCRRTKRGEYADICFPITKDLRQELEKAVLDEYAKRLEEM